MIDIFPGTMNCIDAAGDITRTPLDTGMSWGFVATIEVVRHLSPYFKNNGRVVKAVTEMPIWATMLDAHGGFFIKMRATETRRGSRVPRFAPVRHPGVPR